MNYVDVNVFVYWLTDHPIFGQQASKIIRGIEMGKKACTSSLTIWLLHIFLAREAEDYSEIVLLERIQELPHLKIVPLEMEDFMRGIQCKNEYGIDLEDALHYAVAQRIGAQTIYSNDADFEKTDITRVF
jgi:predicted nucleic acid-binding protein